MFRIDCPIELISSSLVLYQVPRSGSFTLRRVNPSGPVVIILPLDPRFAGSIPAGVDGFFQSVKILSMTSFRREVKPCVPCHRFTVKEPQAEIRASEQNLSDFSRSMSEATLMTYDVKKCRETQQQQQQEL